MFYVSPVEWGGIWWYLGHPSVKTLTTPTVRKLTQKRHNVTEFTLTRLFNYDMMEWEQYDKDTWAYEFADVKRMALIKLTSDNHWTIVLGTITEAEYIAHAQTLSEAKAKCMRYIMLIKNTNNVDKLKWIL